MSRPPLDEFSKRDMNQFNKHYSVSSNVSKTCIFYYYLYYSLFIFLNYIFIL